MKKGFLQVAVEIDYDVMVTEESLEALKGFTGATTADEVMTVHISNLGEKMDKVLAGLPHVRYEIKADFVPVPTADEAPQDTDANADAQDIDDIPELIDVDLEPVEQETADDMVAKDKHKENIELLDKALMDVSIKIGIPVQIKVNAEMYKSIVDKTVGLTDNEEWNISSYQGFPLLEEGMGELFTIEVKGYGGDKHTVSSDEVKS